MGAVWQRLNLVNRIDELETKYADRDTVLLRDDGKMRAMTAQEKVKLRNHVQAQKSRLRKLDSQQQQNDDQTELDRIAQVFLKTYEETLNNKKYDHLRDAYMKKILIQLKNRKRIEAFDLKSSKKNGEDSQIDFWKHLGNILVMNA